MTTIVCLDTEFTGLGPDIDLMSLGLCQVDGDRSFYAECDDVLEETISGFARAHVLPHMTGQRLPRERVAEALGDWIRELPQPVVILSDSHFDWFLLRELLGSARVAGLGLQARLFTPWDLPPQLAGSLERLRADFFTSDRPQHHALNDALALALREQVREALRLGWVLP